MTAKEWLMRARNMEKRIEALQEAKARIYDRAVSITVRPHETPPSGSSGAPDDKIAGYAVASAVVDEQLDKLNEIRAEILQVVGKIEDNACATLLTEYYINGKTWNEVAECMHYSFAHVTKVLHPKALREVENMLINTNSICAIMVMDKSTKV